MAYSQPGEIRRERRRLIEAEILVELQPVGGAWDRLAVRLALSIKSYPVYPPPIGGLKRGPVR